MKLILQHGAQSIEYEFLTRSGTPLSNAQATAVINAAYSGWIQNIDDPPENPTLLEKADLILSLLADHLANSAKRQRRSEMQVDVEQDIETELG